HVGAVGGIPLQCVGNRQGGTWKAAAPQSACYRGIGFGPRMIYNLPAPDGPIDQGDLIDGCPVVRVTGFQPDQPRTATVELDTHRGIVLTQTCGFANEKAENAVFASAFEAQFLIDQTVLKAGDIQGPLP